MNVSRREFVRLAGWSAMTAVAAPKMLFGRTGVAELTELRRNVGIYSDRGGTMGWLVNGDGVVVVDSQFPDTASAFLSELREKSALPIDVLINSHHHPDHTGGNAALRQAAAKIVAHERSAENQRRSAVQRGVEADQAYPDTTFGDEWSVEVGDERIRVKHYGPAHTGGDAAISFERANVVHLGDLLNNRGYPNVDAPAGASVLGWITVLERIAPEFEGDTVYIFGHSEAGYPVVGGRDDLLYQRDYLSALVDAARGAVRDGRSREELIAMESLAGFTHFGGTFARLGLGLGLVYDEVSSGR